MSKEYEIKTLRDICERLADPATRENFRTDFNLWMDAFCATNDALRAQARSVAPRFAMKHRASFQWIDDGKHEMTGRTHVSVGIRMPWDPPLQDQ